MKLALRNVYSMNMASAKFKTSINPEATDHITTMFNWHESGLSSDLESRKYETSANTVFTKA